MAAASAVPSFRVRWQIPDDSAPAVATVLQNSGGPCPLLALANALLLRRTITIPANTQSLSEEQLLGCVCQAESLIGHMDVLPRLGKEVAVDPCFSGTTEFVRSPELAIFEEAKIRLVHGAIPDPHDDVVVECISPLSYNQVCDRLVAAAVQAEEAGGPSTSAGGNAADDENATPTVPIDFGTAKELSGQSSQHTDGGHEEAQDDTVTADVVDALNASDNIAETSVDDTAKGVARDSNAEVSDAGIADAAVEDELGMGIWTGPPHLKPEESSDVTSSTSPGGSDTSDSGELIARNAPFIQAFLDDTASMMTFHGLALLHETLEEGELACLFYNNHFSVLTMNKKRLFMLVTDEGYIRAPNVMYEGLSDLDGNTAFFDANFKQIDMAAMSNASGPSFTQRSAESSRHTSRSPGSQTYDSSRQTRPPGSASQRAGSPASRKSKKLSMKTCSLQ